ncbi:MAG: hypothetical protein CL822_00990 [Crocinitomicaceae bacterium]|nr:hypothetical protein [Crocinitomicaceae bacterium]
MIGEAMLAIKALDSAFVLVQGAIAKKKDVEDMASEVGKFFTAKKQVEQHIANAKKAGNEDLLVGSALEEAITIDQQEERIERMMEKIRDHYMRKGATHRWIKIKAEAAKIEKKRAIKAKERADKNKQDELFIKDLSLVLSILVGGLFITAGILFLIFGFSAE